MGFRLSVDNPDSPLRSPETDPHMAVATDLTQMQHEVRALAAERGALILAHNYQVSEIQDVADYVGDSLGLAREAAKSEAEIIAFCGVHFMAETASVFSPEKRVL